MLVRALAAAIILATSALAIAAPATTEKVAAKFPATQLKLYAIVYRSAQGVNGEMRVNDMPAVTFKGQGNSGSSSAIQAWLQAGTNRIDLTLDKTDGDEPIFISFHGLPAAAMPDDSNELFHVTLKKGTPPGARAYTFEIPAKQAPPTLLWKKAAVTTALTDADKKELRALGTALLVAFQKGDTAAVHKLITFTAEERARATYSDSKEIFSMMESMLPEMKKTFAKAALPEALEYTLIGGGRIVKLTTAGGKPPVSAKSDDGEAALPLSAAKIDGKWTLVP